MFNSRQHRPELREDRHPTIPAPKTEGPFVGWGPRIGLC
jgi:hypothetical protein